MRAQIRGLAQAGENIENGLSLLNVADSGLGTMIDPNLNRLRELAVQAANDTLVDDDRAKIQMETDQIIRGINDIATNTEFNTIKVLSPPVDTIPATPSGTAEIVLVFDDSASMQTQQKEFAANIDSLVNSMKSRGINDIRIGLIYYTDTATKINFNGSEWTIDLSEVISEINEIAKAPSPSGTENSMDAIKTAANYSFRDFAGSNVDYKHIILVTDEPGNDNHIKDDVSNVLTTKNITLHGVYGQSTDIDDVVNSTNGKKVPITTGWGNQLARSIGEAIAEAANDPIIEGDMASLIIHTGANESQNLHINLYDCRVHKIGLKDLKLDTQQNADNAIAVIDAAIGKLSGYRSEYGANYNRLEHAYSNVKSTEENLTKAESLLRDADLAKETIKLNKDRILLQSSQAMMTQVNQMSQNILEILK